MEDRNLHLLRIFAGMCSCTSVVSLKVRSFVCQNVRGISKKRIKGLMLSCRTKRRVMKVIHRGVDISLTPTVMKHGVARFS